MIKQNALLLFFIPLLSLAQIKADETKFLSIVFGGNITQCIIGNDDYTLQYDKNGTENFVLLKANNSASKATNLIVKTDNGYLYNLNLSHGSAANNMLLIKEEQGLKLSNSIQSKTANEGNFGVTEKGEKQDVSSFNCDAVLNFSKKINRILSTKEKITLKLENVVYNNNKIYISIDIANDSKLTYDINFIRSYLLLNNDDISSSSQYLENKPLFVCNDSETAIEPSESRKLVFVYNQFSIDKNKKLVFELNEKAGERNLTLNVNSNFLNNPKKLN